MRERKLPAWIQKWSRGRRGSRVGPWCRGCCAMSSGPATGLNDGRSPRWPPRRSRSRRDNRPRRRPKLSRCLSLTPTFTRPDGGKLAF